MGVLTAEIDPIADFLKLARKTEVRAHTRKSGNKTITVSQHERKEEDAPPAELSGHNHPDLTVQTKRQKELELWKQWKQSGEDPRYLQPLLRSFRPMIRSKSNVYKGRVKMIPDAAIEAEFNLVFVKALKNYDPSKGSLGTYVYRYLDKGNRFITNNQNIGRIPENRIYKIKPFTVARDELEEELGRPAKTEEIAQRLGWSIAETTRMETEVGAGDLTTQNFEEDPSVVSTSREQEVLRLFKYELTGNERVVYEHLTGLGRPQIKSTGEIAKKLKMPDYQVSRLKKAIAKKMSRYINE
jgi:DNA-directed RNA polymerase specialized sigma subunit